MSPVRLHGKVFAVVEAGDRRIPRAAHIFAKTSGAQRRQPVPQS
jgi:hypothetical protein